MDHDYRLEALVSIFDTHANQSEKNSLDAESSFRIKYPDCPVPEHMVNPFNLARALSVMAYELQRLKIITEKE